MADSTWLELHDTIGVTAEGNLEPLADIGDVPILVPRLVTDETGKQHVIEEPQMVKIEFADELGKRPARMVPGTRMVETVDPRIAGFLLGSNEGAVWKQIDTPTRAAVKAAAKALADASEEAGTHAQDPDHPEEG